MLKLLVDEYLFFFCFIFVGNSLKFLIFVNWLIQIGKFSGKFLLLFILILLIFLLNAVLLEFLLVDNIFWN